MSAATACGALALLIWPARRASRRVAHRSGWPPVPPGAMTMPPAFVVAVGVAALAALLSTPLVALLAGCCALPAVRGLRARQRAARAAGGLLVLAEALAVLAAELTAGREFEQAVTAAGGACPDPATGQALVAALRDGPALPDASAGSAAAALDRVRRAARLSARTGCSLAAVATALADDLRGRHRAELELRSATAGPRASAAVLAGLPLLGLAMGTGVGADPWRVLTRTGVGEVLLVAGVALEVLGIAWTGRLLRRAIVDPPAGGRAT